MEFKSTVIRSKILCMYSGGLDSTGALYKVLTDSAYRHHDIHVHNMVLINQERRASAESRAVDLCVEWFDVHCRKFEFTRSTHDYRFMTRNFMWDSDMCGFMAGQITSLNDDVYDYIVMGATKTDFETLHANLEGRIKRAHTFMETAFMNSQKTVPEYKYPVADMTKKEIWDMLPPELRSATWSCRTPIYKSTYTAERCGKCITCKEMEQIGI